MRVFSTGEDSGTAGEEPYSWMPQQYLCSFLVPPQWASYKTKQQQTALLSCSATSLCRGLFNVSPATIQSQ